MEEDIKSFLNYLAEEKKYSPNTLAAYSADLNQLAAFIKSETVQGGAEQSELGLSIEVLSAYLCGLRERKYSLATVARKVAAVKSFLKFMTERGKLKGNLAPILTPPRIRRPVPTKALSVSEVRRLLAEPAKFDRVDAKRDMAMLELLYATGLTASELISLNVSDIDLEKGTVRCLGRGAKVRTIPIDRKLTQLMKAYVDKVRPELLSDQRETALFLNLRGERLTRQGFWLIVQDYADKVGISGQVTPRSLRSSFAAHKLKGGAELQSVQELLGHAHISTTRAYSQAEVST